MKIFKNSLFTFILGGIIFSSISVLAVTALNASQISYTDYQNNETTVEAALDNVYSKLNSKIALNTFGTATHTISHGNVISTRTATLTLNKGKYLLYKNSVVGYHTNSTTDYPNVDTLSNISNSISCTNNCVKENIFSLADRIRSTGTIGSTNYYTITSGNYHLFYVEVVEDGTEISGTSTGGGSNSNVQSVDIVAVPINE